jgi:hypothetical protein
MNKIQNTAFQNELQKTALMPRAFTEFMSSVGMRRAAIKADKAYIRRAAGETKKLLRLDPSLDRKSTYEGILTKLKDEGSAKAKAALEGTKEVAGEGFVAKHKKKLLIGGALGGGALLALSGRKSKEDEQQQMYRTQQLYR